MERFGRDVAGKLISDLYVDDPDGGRILLERARLASEKREPCVMDLLIFKDEIEVFHSETVLLPIASPDGSAMWSVYQILVRLCARSDSSETTTLWTALVGLAATSLVGPVLWQWPDAKGWAMLGAIAMLGSLAHIAFIRALGMTQPSLLQPFNYTLFVWAIAVGYLFFGDVPDGWTLAGAAIIIASGIYVWHRERVRGVVGA